VSLASIARRIADLEERARQKAVTIKRLSLEEGRELLVRRHAEYEIERARFEALPVAEQIDTLARELADQIANWNAPPDAREILPRSDVWEFLGRWYLRIRILELQGGSAELVWVMNKRTELAVRRPSLSLANEEAEFEAALAKPLDEDRNELPGPGYPLRPGSAPSDQVMVHIANPVRPPGPGPLPFRALIDQYKPDRFDGFRDPAGVFEPDL